MDSKATTQVCPAKLPTAVGTDIYKLDCALQPGHAGSHSTVSGISFDRGTIANAQRELAGHRNRERLNRKARHSKLS